MLFPITMMPHIPYWHDPINGTNGSNPEKDLLFSEFKGKSMNKRCDTLSILITMMNYFTHVC